MKWLCVLRAIGAASAIAWAADAVPADAASLYDLDAYLYIPGIPGDATEADHRNWISIQSYAISVQNSGWGSPSSTPSLSPMFITKGVDLASPLLFMAALTGQSYGGFIHTQPDPIVIDVRRRSSDRKLEYVKWLLGNPQGVIVSSYNTAVDAVTDTTLDVFSLDFPRIRYVYYPPQPDGSAGAPIWWEYDRPTHTVAWSGAVDLADFHILTQFNASQAPEPESIALIVIGLASAVSRRRLRRDLRTAEPARRELT